MQRFSRTKLLLGDERFLRLNKSHIAVIGLGAVGGYALEGLARAGVGRLTIVDFDVIQDTNINRQIFALESTLGMSKVAVAEDRVLDINPHCQIDALDRFIDDVSIEEILQTGPDIVIDAIDSLNPKVQLLKAAHRRSIPTFSSMGAALRTDPAHIKVSDISKTKNCPLARRIRQRLKKEGIYTGITCVYSTEPVDFEYPPPSEHEQKSGPSARGRGRRTLGSLPTLTAVFGLTLANEVIRFVAKKL